MSASKICPTNVDFVPCFVSSPTESAMVVQVTASVVLSLLKSPLQTKQIRLTPSLALLVAGLPPAYVMFTAAFGAVFHVLNEA